MPVPDQKDWDEGYFVNLQGHTLMGYKSNGDPTGRINWISDGWACIDTILEIDNKSRVERYFVIIGKSIHGQKFRISLKATDASEGRKLRAALVNEFGVDRIGELNLSVIQQLSGQPECIKLINRPQWLGDQLLAPGLVTDGVEYDLSRKVAVDFSNIGDADVGVEALYCILQTWPPGDVAILIATFLGAPVIARLWQDERFALFIVGVTGTGKTSATMLLNSIYGIGYSLEANLVRWGDGATSNATEHLAAMTGPFPFVIDNFKSYTDKDPSYLQRMVHALLEGTEKDRMTKSSNDLRESEVYLCTPVITGENYPGQDAATRARLVQIDWTEPVNMEKLTEAQRNVKDINALGKEWCLWLSSEERRAAMENVASQFDQVRTYYLGETREAINGGRLATNAAILSLIWDLIGAWPLTADLADEYSEVLKVAIEDHILQSKHDVSEDLDAEKFISWLQAELAVGRYVVSNSPEPLKYHTNSEVIGHYRENKDVSPPLGELFILPSVLSSKLLPAWQRTTNGVRADKKALLRQLVQRKYLLYDTKGMQFTLGRRIEGVLQRVHVLVWNKVVTGEPVTEKQDAPINVTGVTVVTGSDDNKFCFEKFDQKNGNIAALQKQNNNITSNTSNNSNNVSSSSDSTVTKVLLVDNSIISSSEEEIRRETLRLKATVSHQMPLKKRDPDAPTRVRFLKEYRTQIPRPGVANAYDDTLYHVGEIVEIPAWKIKDLVAFGIVEVLA